MTESNHNKETDDEGVISAEIKGVVSAEIKTLNDVFEQGLKIPSYQRPYKWNIDNVHQLWLDLKKAFEEDKDKTYRLGTLVVHKSKLSETEESTQGECHDIVDGQQRLVTLALLLRVLSDDGTQEGLKSLLEHKFEEDISKENIAENIRFLKKRVGGMGKPEEFRNFLLEKCEFVYVAVNSLGQAFQFFDSQNARGKPLEAYDLLKAFHLRAIPQDIAQNRLLTYVTNWESAVDEEKDGNAKDGKPTLAKIINFLLFRLRKIRRDEMDFFEFTTDKLDIFKGLDIKDSEKYLYLKAVNSANFQICQTLFNGENFFKYIEHYRTQYQELFAEDGGLLATIDSPIDKSTEKPESSVNSSLNNQEKSKKETWYKLINHRDINRLIGDENLRNFFELSILFYYDKFGTEGLKGALHKAFLNAYQVRLLNPAQVKMGRENINLLLKFIRCIDYAQQPSDIEKFMLDTERLQQRVDKHSKEHNGSKTNASLSFKYILNYFKKTGLVRDTQ